MNFPNFLSLFTNLCHGFHFLFAQSLKVSQWWELRVCSDHFVDIFFPCHLFRLLESPEFGGALQSLYSPNISFPSLFFSRLFVIFLTPTSIFCAKQKHLYICLKFFFDRQCLRSYCGPREVMRQAKQKQTLKPVLQEAISKFKTYNDSSLRRKSTLLNLVSANLHLEVVQPFKAQPPWCVGDNIRVN